jgi:hypothetical protein
MRVNNQRIDATQHALDPRYLAGFFDGEGSVGVYKTGLHSTRLLVQLVQTDCEFSRELLERLRCEFEGHITRTLSTSGRPKLNWQVSGDAALVFLRFIRPFLRLKLTQAEFYCLARGEASCET